MTAQTKLSENQIRDIVRKALNESADKIPLTAGFSTSPTVTTTRLENRKGIFNSIKEACDAAWEAFQEYKNFSIQDRKNLIAVIRETGMKHREELSQMILEETQMGRYEDKLQKHEAASLATPGVDDITTQAWSGKFGLALEEYAPYGVIGAITPSTHPSETIINNLIMMMSAGNTVVFGTHPAAKKVSAFTVELINKALVKAGAPENCVCTISEPTIQSAEEIFQNSKIGLLSITGGPAVVAAAMRSNKKVIAAGPGNPPVLIDETADLRLAAERITRSAGFDNNILCTAEKEIFIIESKFEAFMDAMAQIGNVRLNSYQIEKLAEQAFEKKKHLVITNRQLVGRNASVLAKIAGVEASDKVRLLYGETTKDHAFVQHEQLMPFIPVVKVRNFDEAMECCLQAEHGYSHSASIFTNDMNRATIFGRKMNCTICVINGGTHQGDGGIEGEGTLSYTIATPTGEGITRPRNFARIRRIMNAGLMRFV